MPLYRAQPPSHDLRSAVHPDALRPTGWLAETFGRGGSLVNQAVLTSGTLRLQAVYLTAGQTVANIHWFSGPSAAGTPTNQWAGLWSDARVQLAVSANGTTAAWAANTLKTFAMTTAYVVPTSGLYYIGLMVAATTVPSLVGAASMAVVGGQAVALGGNSTTGLAAPPANGTTATAITANGVIAYGGVA